MTEGESAQLSAQKEFLQRLLAETGVSEEELVRATHFRESTVRRYVGGNSKASARAIGIIERAARDIQKHRISRHLAQESVSRPELVQEGDPSQEYGVKLRRVPVISMARAGFLASYDELPMDWQHSVASDCPDPKAFGLRVEGDSMEDSYHDGDIVIVMTSFVPYPDSLVVAKLTDGDVMLKYYSILDSKGERIRLSSQNPRYGPRDLSIEDVEWIYPVFGHMRTTWNEERWKRHRTQREESYEARRAEIKPE